MFQFHWSLCLSVCTYASGRQFVALSPLSYCLSLWLSTCNCGRIRALIRVCARVFVFVSACVRVCLTDTVKPCPRPTEPSVIPGNADFSWIHVGTHSQSLRVRVSLLSLSSRVLSLSSFPTLPSVSQTFSLPEFRQTCDSLLEHVQRL